MPFSELLPFLKYGVSGISAIALIYGLAWNVQLATKAQELTIEKIIELRKQAHATFVFAFLCLLLVVATELAANWKRLYTVSFDLVPSDFLDRASSLPGLNDVRNPIVIRLAGSGSAAKFKSGNAQLQIADGSAVSIDVNQMSRVFERNKVLKESLSLVASGEAGLDEPQR